MTDIAENSTEPERRLPPPGESLSIGDAKQEIQELTAALAARDRFISVMGHELRNALSPMVLLAESFATLAEGSQPPGKLFSRLAVLTSNLNKLIATVGRILEIADLRRGKLALEPTTADLVDVVEEVCRESRREAAAGGAELVVVAAGPVAGYWDRGRVKQIVANLVSNAIRYAGGGRIELAIRGRAGLGELVVEDHGPGIDPAVMPGLFDFAGHCTARRSGGFGIGLWVVKTLCSAMHGSVTVESGSGGGARFCVVLPRG